MLGADRSGPPRVRVGAVSYLNSKPLVWDLRRWAPEAELVYDVPSRLADQLAAGRLDVALIPSIEAARRPGYRRVSDACIACRGPVLSVKLLSRKPWADIRTLALAEGSRSSVLLARVLLWERYRVRPRLSRLPIGASVEETDADAVLLIGDRAIGAAPESYPASWDLGEQWVRWCGLPFVFAYWTARAEAPLGDLAEALERARDAGLARAEQLAAEAGPAAGLSPAACLDYFQRHLHYRMGPEERRGLALFLQCVGRLERETAPGAVAAVREG